MRRAALAFVLLLSGCAYFNALYNARRLYDQAEQARERGDRAAAQGAYRESLDKAARSFESDPDGRWADDALLLVAQNHFALGNCEASRAALQRLGRESQDAALLARASVYLGAVEVCLGNATAAMPHLDQAVAGADSASATAALARLWRARAAFELGRDTLAWNDLTLAAARSDAIGREAQIERIRRGTERDRPEQAVAAFHVLLRDDQGDLFADTLGRLADAMSERWGGQRTREALEPLPDAPWPVPVRDRFMIERARHAALAGDTATAIEELDFIAGRASREIGARARMTLARVRLTAATTHAELDQVRTLLLPALSEPEARPLIEAIGLVGVLLERARDGQPIAFFAAAEVARDVVGARLFARRLFLTYAELVGDTPWATKALIAALALSPDAQEAAALRARIAATGDPYALATTGQVAPAYGASEERLAAVLGPLLARARAELGQRDLAVRQVISELDSVAAVTRADSVALACGTMLDSLGVAGIRRDSVQAACLRQQPELIDSFMAVDTALLRDSTRAEDPARNQRGRREAEAEVE